MAKLPAHLFVSSCDGALYHTRVANWSSLPPLRANYSRGHRDIGSVADLKATLRNGAYAWPGGYPLYFLLSDGEALSFAAVTESRSTLQCVMTATADPRDNSGWRIVATDINYEDPDLYCVQSGERIESAYAEDPEDSDASETDGES